MNYFTKVPRRKVMLFLIGAIVTTVISSPSEAAKKGKKTRSDRYYPRNRSRNYDDDTSPSPTPSPTPPAPEPYRPTSPVVMLGVGGGVLGVFGLMGAWLIKVNQRSTPPPTPSSVKPPKPVRQVVPEVADWYVFRSGKAEGPYTALQLWEVQKITARTKVRRGEADWQRAGEVSGLAKYLSKK